MIPTGNRSEKGHEEENVSTPRRTSTVYEHVEDIANYIARPAIIQDATRDEVEALYDFKSCLASGGSATVWRAVERGTGRHVAIKVVDKKLLLPALLNMEVTSLQRSAGHPNIIQLLAAYELPADDANPQGEWHLVMELAEGGELFERLLQHGAYSEKVASQLLRQVTRAVYHLHSCGVCHRDIKPENVVLMAQDPEAPVKLIDFGAAVVLEEDEQVICGGKVGTWSYWAPELARKDMPYDSAVDLWSLGVLLYIMLSGRHPFEQPGMSSEAVQKRILAGNYDFDSKEWRNVSPRAIELVKLLLQTDPERRLSAAQLLSHSWVRGEDVPEKPLPETVERLRAFKKASTAIHGSLLMAALLHQESLRDQDFDDWEPSADPDPKAAGKHGHLRRTHSVSEGVGMRSPDGVFNVVRAAYQLFDPDNKGHIAAEDLRRVCAQLGHTLGEDDVSNMLSVLAPSENQSAAVRSPLLADEAPQDRRAISFEKFIKMMESSYRSVYDKGECIFRQGDAVDGFYIVMSGECVAQASAKPGASPQQVARLGPGDWFGETGLLEGRPTRNTDVVCSTPVEVLKMDTAMFLQLAAAPPGSAGAELAARITERAEARQRTRLKRAIEMTTSEPMPRVQFHPGEIVFKQGEPATHFYIVAAGNLTSSFIASTGEEAKLRTLQYGDQFGHDAVMGERHDSTVQADSEVELIAVPREELQKAFLRDEYLTSVWQAPARRSMLLRRQKSLSLASPHLPPGLAEKAAEKEAALLEPDVTRGDGRAASARLPSDEFGALTRRARIAKLAEGEVAFSQGELPEAVYLLQSGRCQVELPSNAESREPRLLEELTAGDHFGESGILEGRSKRLSTVRCISPDGCEVGMLGKGAFEAVLRAQPELRLRFEAGAADRHRVRLRRVLRTAAESYACEQKQLQAGEVVFDQGEHAQSFYIVESGVVEMSYKAADGRLLPTRQCREGDVFGTSGIIGDKLRRHRATALENTTIKVIQNSRFNDMAEQDVLLAQGLQRVSSAPLETEQQRAQGERGTSAEQQLERPPERKLPVWDSSALPPAPSLSASAAEGRAAQQGRP